MKPVAPLRQSNSTILTSADAAPNDRPARLTLDQLPIAPTEPSTPSPSTKKTAAPWEVAVFRATIVTLALYLGWVGGDALGLWSASRNVPIVTQTLLVFLSASAAALAMGASYRPNLGRATQRAWRLFAVAQARHRHRKCLMGCPHGWREYSSRIPGVAAHRGRLRRVSVVRPPDIPGQTPPGR